MRILIADDHEVFLEGLKVLLQRLGPENSVVACSDFAGALEAATKGEPFDLVILDLHMPGADGIRGVETFHSYCPDPPLVVMSGHYDRNEILESLRRGAAGFLPKTLKAEVVINALRLVLAGEKFIPAELLAAGESALGRSESTYDGRAQAALSLLTLREADVLEQLLDCLSNTEIGRALDIREVTVKLHLRSVYRKLGVKNRTQAVKFVLDAQWQR